MSSSRQWLGGCALYLLYINPPSPPSIIPRIPTYVVHAHPQTHASHAHNYLTAAMTTDWLEGTAVLVNPT